MSRLKILVFLIIGLLLSQSLPAFSDSKVADCISLKFPTATSSSTLIILKVDVYAICDSVQLGRGNGQRPLYEMPDEDSLFILSSCNGPAVAPLIGSGFLGTATCSLRVGSNTLPSPRTGATSTVIKVWFAWDFSTKSISVPHAAIPSGTNGGWGGSTAAADKAAADAAAAKAAADTAAAKAAANAAAELKAKQEAEAKAAADAAAAELKAKQEAEAKAAADAAAAELKAKQEAEAKAAADAAILKLQLEEFNEVSDDYKEMMKKIVQMKLIFPFTSSLLGMETKMKKLPIILGEDLTTARANITNVNKWLDDNKKVWEKTQKMVITCVKGKMTKKVTAVKPKCPAGYKVKN